MGRRSDAEAANRQIDDHLYLRRTRSLGARRQLFDLLADARWSRTPSPATATDSGVAHPLNWPPDRSQNYTPVSAGRARRP